MYLYIMHTKIAMNEFSPHLFWDTDRSALDPKTSAPYIVTQVVEYGLLSDWNLLLELYSKDELREIAVNLRSLDPVSISFLAHYLGVDRTEFRCYTPKQSHQDFWRS